MSCLIESDIDECYDLCYHAIKQARKKFQCCECRDDIHEGELHDVFVGEIRGEIDVHRTCITCESISEKFLCQRPYLGMYEEIFNAVDNDPKIGDCILMTASKEEYEKLVKHVSLLDQDPYGEDDELEDD